MESPAAVLESPRFAYSLERAAEVTDLSVDTLRRAIRAGQLEAVKVGKLVRIRPEAITAWLDNLPAWGE